MCLVCSVPHFRLGPGVHDADELDGVAVLGVDEHLLHGNLGLVLHNNLDLLLRLLGMQIELFKICRQKFAFSTFP